MCQFLSEPVAAPLLAVRRLALGHREMFECLILGDSIGVGTAQAINARAALHCDVMAVERASAKQIQAWRKLSCPRLSGPSTMIVWIMKGTTNADQEAQAGRDYWQAA